MATLIRTITLVFLIAGNLYAQSDYPKDDKSASGRERETVEGLFALAPGGAYEVWWRPTDVVSDTRIISNIQAVVSSLNADATLPDIKAKMGELFTSAFLPPVLATKGTKGEHILTQLLNEYGNKNERDDRWLLIVAALARVRGEKAGEVLLAELDRIHRKWKRIETVRIGDQMIDIPRRDARIPLLDAILASQATRERLNGRILEDLGSKYPESVFFIYLAGCEWGKLLMAKQSFCTLLQSCLETIETEDYQKWLNSESPSEKLLALSEFMTLHFDDGEWFGTIFPEDSRAANHAMLDYLRGLRLQALINECGLNEGRYQIDTNTVRQVAGQSRVAHCRSMSWRCAILIDCIPSESIQQWRTFLDFHASGLNKETDGAFVEYMKNCIKKTYKGPCPSFGELPPPLPTPRKPGVYLQGFRANEQR